MNKNYHAIDAHKQKLRDRIHKDLIELLRISPDETFEFALRIKT